VSVLVRNKNEGNLQEWFWGKINLLQRGEKQIPLHEGSKICQNDLINNSVLFTHKFMLFSVCTDGQLVAPLAIFQFHRWAMLSYQIRVRQKINPGV